MMFYGAVDVCGEGGDQLANWDQIELANWDQIGAESSMVVDAFIDNLFSYLCLVNRVNISSTLFPVTVLLRGLHQRFTSTHDTLA
jgi:hypothetical protein